MREHWGISSRTFSPWVDALPDTRFQPFVCYPGRFLFFWGLGAFLFRLGARRQLDFDLAEADTCVLTNFNSLVGTDMESLPVNGTLDHYLGHTGSGPIREFRTRMIRRLIRMKALDDARLLRHFVVPLDATTYLSFQRRHCSYCLTQKHDSKTVYMHQVLEAKIVSSSGLALSVGSEFIMNDDLPPEDSKRNNPEGRKQDCELAALSRLAPQLKTDFPHTPLCLSVDSEFACGRFFQIAKDHSWAYVATFKQGRLPAVWADFQGLLKLVPENILRLELPDGTRQLYRWVNALSYRDDQKRTHSFDAIQCIETKRNGEKTTFAWLTSFKVNKNNVVCISQKGGREHWNIENQGFNTQKNGGMNLEHAYSYDPEKMKAYYYLLQIAHILLQLLEKGSLLKRVAKDAGKTTLRLYGSLKNISRRLLECFRYIVLAPEVFDPQAAARIRINLDTS